MAKAPEIDKMLVLSTAHLRQTTCNEWLADAQKHRTITCYPKGEYGWFVYSGDPDNFQCELPASDQIKDHYTLPGELQLVINYAQEHGCSWITFDRDAETVEGLVTYDW